MVQTIVHPMNIAGSQGVAGAARTGLMLCLALLVGAPSSVRSAVALSYYRMAMAARGMVWVGDAPAAKGAAQ